MRFCRYCGYEDNSDICFEMSSPDLVAAANRIIVKLRKLADEIYMLEQELPKNPEADRTKKKMKKIFNNFYYQVIDPFGKEYNEYVKKKNWKV